MDDYYKNRQIVDERKRASESKNQQQNKDLLKRKGDISIKTTMIGALEDFEQRFGHLWGIDKRQCDLTNEELHWREIWQEVRQSILDRGNNSIKILTKTIEQCKVSEYPARKTTRMEIKNGRR